MKVSFMGALIFITISMDYQQSFHRLSTVTYPHDIILFMRKQYTILWGNVKDFLKKKQQKNSRS
jgi:hypothetical protein